MEELQRAGLIRWNGKKLPPAKPIAKLRGNKTIAEIIIKDRGDRVGRLQCVSQAIRLGVGLAGGRSGSREAELVATGLITRAEVSAAVARLVRTRSLRQDEREAILKVFRRHWLELTTIQLTEVAI